MAFQLNSVVPWGRTFAEYQRMFLLNDEDRTKKIAGFGDGPASFNREATEQGWSVTSFDPVYQFSKARLAQRIEEVRVTVMEQMRENQENYVWTQIRSLEELEQIRMSAMEAFLEDYDKGKLEGRYVPHALPKWMTHEDDTFDLGLSSHFLLLYTSLGYAFHIQAITEMLRVCKEVRIFPLLDLNGENTELIADVLAYFQRRYQLEILETNYEFQKGGNRLLVIRK